MRLNCVYLAHSFVIVSVVPQLVLSASGWTKSLLLIQQDLDSEESNVFYASFSYKIHVD